MGQEVTRLRRSKCYPGPQGHWSLRSTLEPFYYIDAVAKVATYACARRPQLPMRSRTSCNERSFQTSLHVGTTIVNSVLQIFRGFVVRRPDRSLCQALHVIDWPGHVQSRRIIVVDCRFSHYSPDPEFPCNIDSCSAFISCPPTYLYTGAELLLPFLFQLETPPDSLTPCPGMVRLSANYGTILCVDLN
jgi:hypothetical protein